MPKPTWGESFEVASMSAMQVYEQTLVGPLFTPWGRALVADLKIAPGEVVCDVACGPGSVTRIAAEAAGRDGKVIGCDISNGMLDVARAKPALGDECAPIAYHVAPAESLPLDEASIDVVMCQQGLQFFPDRAAAAREMHRVLRPGGRLGVSVWTAIEGTPPFKALADAVEAVCGEDVATRYRGGPWGFPDIAPLGAVIREGGFLDVHIETRELPLIFPGGVEQLYATLQFSGIVSDLAERDEAAVADLRKMVEDGLAPFLVGDEVRSFARSHVARATR